jgi:proteasome component ECM29
LNQFNDPSVGVFVKNFTIIYLEMAYSRMPAEQAAKFIPKLLPGIASRPAAQKITVLHMILPVRNICHSSHSMMVSLSTLVNSFALGFEQIEAGT